MRLHRGGQTFKEWHWWHGPPWSRRNGEIASAIAAKNASRSPATDRLIFITIILCLCLAACENVATTQPIQEESRVGRQRNDAIAITNVTLIDVASGARQTAMTVLTKAGQISNVGRALSVPEGTARVDGTGKFLIPGLWDMHAHHQATGRDSLDLYLANGVVGTRDMGSDVEFILPLRDRIDRGELLGPEIVAAGPILDDAPPDWPFRRRVSNAQDAREAVRDLKRHGVDFIKVHDHTPRDAYFAIADEARKVGLPFAGHVPIGVTVEEAPDSGIKSIEHLANFRVFRDCSGNEPYSPVRCRSLFERLAARGVWETPTITFSKLIPDLFVGKPLPHVEFASDSLLELIRKNAEASNLDEEGLAFFRSNSRTSLVAIRDLFASGNHFLAGCDGLVPGFCLHDELEEMTRAGLSPLQAIQTATINPAKFLGREKMQGTIEIGKRADLVLLEADPLTDISNTRRIDSVMVRGQLFLRPQVDRIIAAHRAHPRTRK